MGTCYVHACLFESRRIMDVLHMFLSDGVLSTLLTM